MVPGKVSGMVGMTTGETEIGSEGGVGTMTINGPEIANVTGGPLPRPIVLHHYRRAVTITTSLVLTLAEPNRCIHLEEGARLPPEVREAGLVDHPPCLARGRSRQIPIHHPYRKAHLLVEKVRAQIDIHVPCQVLHGQHPNATLPRQRAVSSISLTSLTEKPCQVDLNLFGEKTHPMRALLFWIGQMDVEMATESLTKGKDRSDNRDGEPHGEVDSPRRAGSPLERQQQLIPTLETVGMSTGEAAVTQPYLPSIPRYEAKPRFSAAYESEATAECRRCLKASRRAFHELEMTTLDLRAAQHRRELAEAHRKKAHHGQLGIDAEIVQ
ncbi:hypothetical protein J3R83DRAFT_1787 [Lanmaoa asiatica]|nr:hypothetical protein J3R83DRAFT_1787 [Lanmaoa asiatica]